MSVSSLTAPNGLHLHAGAITARGDIDCAGLTTGALQLVARDDDTAEKTIGVDGFGIACLKASRAGTYLPEWAWERPGNVVSPVGHFVQCGEYVHVTLVASGLDTSATFNMATVTLPVEPSSTWGAHTGVIGVVTTSDNASMASVAADLGTRRARIFFDAALAANSSVAASFIYGPVGPDRAWPCPGSSGCAPAEGCS